MAGEPDSTVVVYQRGPTRRTSDTADAQLVILTGPSSGVRLPIAGDIIVGRGSEAVGRIEDDGISRRHFSVGANAEGAFEVVDLDSRNGTFLNGLQVKRAQLSFGDKIAIGAGTVLMFARQDPLEERVQQAQKLQVLGELASGIAHDFNNLLSVVLSSVGYLRTSELSRGGSVDACLNDMDYAARRAIDLAQQLTAFAQTSGRQHAALDFSRLVEDASRLIRRMLPRSVDLVVEAEPQLATEGDAGQLLQVLMNLCINASDAMPDGGTIRVVVRNGNRPRRVPGHPANNLRPFVELLVSDEGAGMDEATQARAFEPFFTTKGRGNGTGLGLSTAHRVVAEHGGEIKVRSECGVGTSFCVTLPTLQAPVGDTGLHAAVQDPAAQVDAVILLVEDEPLVRSTVSRVLGRSGAHVMEAADGLEALEVYRENRAEIGLVILDLDIPKLGGAEVLEAIREMRPDAKVLISSGYVSVEREEALERIGVSGFLHKPYDSRELLERVHEMLLVTDLVETRLGA